jgi:hypothetical protein
VYNMGGIVPKFNLLIFLHVRRRRRRRPKLAAKAINPRRKENGGQDLRQSCEAFYAAYDDVFCSNCNEYTLNAELHTLTESTC